MRMRDGRPKKKRIIREKPESFRFSPRGKRGKPDNIILKMEEFEALRLADYLSMPHKEAASSMEVSRQTFERVLKKARRTVSEALIKGKGIKIWGGSYDFGDEGDDD
ncbi:MAG: DUF134 domain-containing protein [Candidatus Omnitrophica bacterium]|nr:DUF134 domain-containing protein [Candidatus Omnitrophota bacterium]